MFQQRREVRPSASVTSLATKKTEHFLLARDKTRIHYEFWLPKSLELKRIILCIPGYDSTTAYFREFAGSMNARGIGVCSFDLRGFGKSEGRGSIGKSLEDIQLLMDFIKQEHPGVTVDLLGHSVGAVAYALQYAISNPDQINKLVLVAPATKIKFKIWFNHLLRSFHIPLQFKLIDPEVGEITKNSGKKVRYSPFHVFDIGFNCNFLSHRRAPKVQVRTLVIQSDQAQDVIVRSDDIAEFSRKMPNAETYKYTNAGHLVFTGFSPKVSSLLEAQRLAVFEHISQWLHEE